MIDEMIADGALSSYRRVLEPNEQLVRETVPATVFRHRNGREHPDCMTDIDDND